MSYNSADTICAVASGSGGARGIVRISGASAIDIAAASFQGDDAEAIRRTQTDRKSRAVSGSLFIGRNDMLRQANPPPAPPYEGGEFEVPCDLFLWPSERSYTREPVAELHTLGSPPVLEAVVGTVCQAGARLAEPGEFTLRAFLGGRLDLTQAEAVLGVINASGADELQSALAQLAGNLARPLGELRENLLQLLAELEAGLDFVDEDIEFISQAEILRRLDAASTLLADVNQQMQSRLVTAERTRVALVGRANAGKSSLFNALVARSGAGHAGTGAGSGMPALVSPERGTTRDYLTATIALGGAKYQLIDTAGVGGEDFRADDIEVAAHRHAVEQRRRAVVRALCIDACELIRHGKVALSEDRIAQECDLVVVTKSDLAENIQLNVLGVDKTVVVTSSLTGAGLDEFSHVVRHWLTQASAARDHAVAATAARCRESVRLAHESLRRAAELAEIGNRDELVAAEIRAALAELGKVVGVVYTDDLLDRIFKSFCIGK
jgi:tRNA modification GTPase